MRSPLIFLCLSIALWQARGQDSVTLETPALTLRVWNTGRYEIADKAGGVMWRSNVLR